MGSEYGNIPYEVDEITSWLETWLNANLPDLIADNVPESLTENIVTRYFASDDLIKSNDAVDSKSSVSWVLAKEIEILQPINPNSEFKIKFSIKSPQEGNTSAQIYRNGSAVGTVRSRSYNTWLEFTENITSWGYGDKIQIYVKSEAGKYIDLRYFRIYGESTTFMENTVT